MPLVNFEMEPFSGDVELNSTALLIIDMQVRVSSIRSACNLFSSI